MKTNVPPDQFRPVHPADLIGSPANSATSLLRAAMNLKFQPSPTWRLLLHGEPGCGKTTIAELIARALAAHPVDIDEINGRNVTIDVVRDWQALAPYASLFGGWKVKLINEADLIPAAAQDLMLSYLDKLPQHTAVLATSNATMATLSQRFATRLGPVKIDSPSDVEIAEFLRRRWKLNKAAANFIAVGSCGNVRDALLRASNYLILGRLEDRPQPPAAPIVSLSGSEAARKAWATRRDRDNQQQAA